MEMKLLGEEKKVRSHYSNNEHFNMRCVYNSSVFYNRLEVFMDYSFSLIEDNESCFCGSEVTFAKCCKQKLISTKSTRKSLDDFKGEEHLNSFMHEQYKKSEVKQCLHPNQCECKGDVIDAHALQNNKVLTRLALDGHVMVIDHVAKIRKQVINITLTPEFLKNEIETSSENFSRELKECLKNVDEKELCAFMGKTIKAECEMPIVEFKMKKSGRNKATTFRGFCSAHDKETFKPIEDFKYIGSEEQDFLFAYRTFSQEYHEQLAVDKIRKQQFAEDPNLCYNHQFVQDYRYIMKKKRSLDIMKNELDNALITRNFSILNTVKIKTNIPYDFALTSVILPEVDLKGNILNDAYSSCSDSKHILLTIFPTDTETFILFSWLKQHNIFFESYSCQLNELTENDVKYYVSNLISYSPNIVLSPRLWNKMSEYERRSFLKSLEFQGEETTFSQATPKNLSKIRTKTLEKRKFLLETPSYNLFQ